MVDSGLISWATLVAPQFWPISAIPKKLELPSQVGSFSMPRYQSSSMILVRWSLIFVQHEGGVEILTCCTTSCRRLSRYSSIKNYQTTIMSLHHTTRFNAGLLREGTHIGQILSKILPTLLKFHMEPKNDGFFKRNLLLQGAIFRFHVKLWESRSPKPRSTSSWAPDISPANRNIFLGSTHPNNGEHRVALGHCWVMLVHFYPKILVSLVWICWKFMQEPSVIMVPFLYNLRARKWNLKLPLQFLRFSSSHDFAAKLHGCSTGAPRPRRRKIPKPRAELGVQRRFLKRCKSTKEKSK